MNIYEILDNRQIELLIKSSMKLMNKIMTDEEEKEFNMKLTMNPNLIGKQIEEIFDTIGDVTNY